MLDQIRWQDAALHAVGEATIYKLSQSVLISQILSPMWYAATSIPPAMQQLSDWLYGVNTQYLDRDVSRFCDGLDAASIPLAEADSRNTLGLLIRDGFLIEKAGTVTLSLQGLERAIDIRAEFSPKSITSFWVDKAIDAAYIKRLEGHLAQRCPKSVQFGELGDLICNYFTNVICRDGLKNRLRQGRQPSPSDLKNWIYRAALSIWRDEGRDALTRGFKGARTEKDLHQEDEADIVSRSVPSEHQGLFLITDEEGGTGEFMGAGSASMPLIDVLGGDMAEEMVHRLAGQRGMQQAEAVLRRAKSPDRFGRVFQSLVEGELSVQEIGQQEGVTRARAAVIISNIRDTFEEEKRASSLVYKILLYIKENPYSTSADIESPVDDSPQALGGGLGVSIPPMLLSLIVDAGFLIEQNESFVISPQGEAHIRNGIDAWLPFRVEASHAQT